MFDKKAILQGLYQFKEGSPAQKLGIKPIDLRKVGSSLANPSRSSGKKNVFEFTDGSALDAEAGVVGARMTLNGVTLTTRAIIGSDGTDQGNTTTIFKGVDALSINTGSVSGPEYQNFDPNEAWVFDFDADVTLNEIRFAGLESGETMTVTILDGSNDGKGSVQTVTDTNMLVLKKQVTAGTDIRIEQTSGKSRIDSIAVGISN